MVLPFPFLIKLVFEKAVLETRGNRSTRRKTSRSKKRSNDKINPYYDVTLGIQAQATLAGDEFSYHCATIA